MVTLKGVPCPTGCGRDLTTLYPFCPPCWGSLPPTHRSALDRTWGAYCTRKGDAQLVAYTKAYEAALATLRKGDSDGVA